MKIGGIITLFYYSLVQNLTSKNTQIKYTSHTVTKRTNTSI